MSDFWRFLSLSLCSIFFWVCLYIIRYKAGSFIASGFFYAFSALFPTFFASTWHVWQPFRRVSCKSSGCHHNSKWKTTDLLERGKIRLTFAFRNANTGCTSANENKFSLHSVCTVFASSIRQNTFFDLLIQTKITKRWNIPSTLQQDA